MMTTVHRIFMLSTASTRSLWISIREWLTAVFLRVHYEPYWNGTA